MANIRVDLNHAPLDGEAVTFKAPCDASNITGLVIYYDGESKVFTLTDANGGDIGVLDNIFSEGAIVKAILDTEGNKAFVQNPNTNTYLEGRFTELDSKLKTTALSDLSNVSNEVMKAKVEESGFISGGGGGGVESFNGRQGAVVPQEGDYTAEDVGAVPAEEDADHPGCYYRMVDGVKEWLTPPMQLGVEYRTTERYNGKPVYAKLFDFGAMPNKGTKSVSYAENVEAVIDASGVVSQGSAFIGDYNHEFSCKIVVNTSLYAIIAEGDLRAYTLKVQIKYTKTTD